MKPFFSFIILSAFLNFTPVCLAENRTRVPVIPEHQDPRATGLTPSEQLDRVRTQALPKDTNRYFDGIPAMFFKGKECSQSTSVAFSGGSTGVTINCYLDEFTPRRQCSFHWDSHLRTAEIRISTYFDNREGDWNVHEQENYSIARRQGMIGISLKEVPFVAQGMINEFCGSRLPTSTKAVYRNSNFAPINGIPCTYNTVRHPPSSSMTSEIYCHDFTVEGKPFQCHVRKDGANNKEYFNSPIEFQTTGYAHSQSGKTSDQKHIKASTEEPNHSLGFEGQARKWLEKNCKR